MKKIVNIFTITTILLLTITSCSTECDEPTKVPLKRLNEYVSYTGYDTLRFLHNNTDTQTFIGQGINYFWVRKPAFDDTQCPEDHESLAIQFKNHQNGDVIKMEYVYDYEEFNGKNYLRFYFNSINMGTDQKIYNDVPINFNGYLYSRLYFFSESKDTLQYIAYSSPLTNGYGGIIKIKISNKTFSIIR